MTASVERIHPPEVTVSVTMPRVAAELASLSDLSYLSLSLSSRYVAGIACLYWLTKEKGLR